MIVKAKFLGKKATADFVKGQTYELQLRQSKFNQPFIYYNGEVIPYQNLFTFLNDWADVSQIKP